MAYWVGKKYILDKFDNFDAFADAIALSEQLRNAIKQNTKLEFELSKENDFYVISYSSPIKSTKFKFQPGVEFDEESIAGHKVKSVVTMDDENHFTEIQRATNLEIHIRREFSSNGFTSTLSAGGVSAVMHFKNFTG